MSRRALSEPSRALLVVAAMWRPEFGDDRALGAVKEAFGPFDGEQLLFDFAHSAYYEREMGAGLRKAFCPIRGLVERGSLARHKHTAGAVENRFLDSQGHRRLNVDPMLVTMENVVIATSKNFPHRVYLGEGVFGDVGLIRRKGRFERLPWTYGDYAEHSGWFDALHALLSLAPSE